MLIFEEFMQILIEPLFPGNHAGIPGQRNADTAEFTNIRKTAQIQILFAVIGLKCHSRNGRVDPAGYAPGIAHCLREEHLGHMLTRHFKRNRQGMDAHLLIQKNELLIQMYPVY